MKLVQSHFSSGQRVPVLVQDGSAAPLPKLVPFIYVQLRFKHRAYNTVTAHLRAIQAFYTYIFLRDKRGSPRDNQRPSAEPCNPAKVLDSSD